MPNIEEDTLATSGETVTPESGTQPESQVTNSQDEANTPSQTAEEMFLGRPKSEWEKLDTENKRLRSGQSTLERKLARFERQMQESRGGLDEYANGEEWVNDLLLKQAEYEMKEGLEGVFSEYPNLPENVKKAVQRNPRGFVQPGTVYVTDAIDDIRDYLDEISQSMGDAQASTPTGQPKRFPIAPTNSSSTGTGNPETEELMGVLKGKGGMNELFRLFTEKKISERTLNSVLEEAKARGMNLG